MTTASTTSLAQAPLTVAVTALDRFTRERIAATLTGATGLDVRSVAAGELAGHGQVDCVVLAAPRSDGRTLAGLKKLRSSLPDTPIVLLCERATRNEIRRALENGANGLVRSEDVESALPAAISAVRTGQICVPGEQRNALGDLVLTTREKQILSLVVMGMTNGEIARRLYLAESTVKSHLSAAFSKLGVASRNEAVALILDPERGRGLGILTIPSERL